MSRANRARPGVISIVLWATLLAVSAGIVVLTTTEGVFADAYVVKLYRFLGDESRTRVALSRLMNGLTMSSSFRPHIDLLFSEIREGPDARWLFDKVTRVLLRFGQSADARRFSERWLAFDPNAGATLRAVEIDIAEKKQTAALARCNGTGDEARRDPALALSCADVSAAASDPHLARDFTRRVRDNALTNPRPAIAAHLAARDADDAIREGRLDNAREAVARGLRAIGTFDPATLAAELRPIVVRLLLTDAHLGHLNTPALGKRLLLAVSVVERAPEFAGLARELIDGALARNAHVYDAVAAAAPTLAAASPEFADWWRRTGLSPTSPNGEQLRLQRLETLARVAAPPRQFSVRISIADLPDRLHNIALFSPFGVFLLLALRRSSHLGFFGAFTLTVLVASAFAAALEAIQYFWIPRRHADVNDIWTAALGALAGGLVVLFVTGVCRLARRRPSRRSKI